MADQKQSLKVVKKKWYPIYATENFDKALIGECLVVEPSQLVGRIVSVNLMTLTDDIKQQNIYLKFKVISNESDSATAQITGFEVIPAALRRLVRRGCNRLDASFICETSDGHKIRIKPFLVTKSAAKGTILHKLRDAIVRHIAAEVKKYPFDELVKLMITNKIQTGAKAALKKIYPVRSCEIKAAQIVEKGDAIELEEVKAPEPEEKEEAAN